MLIIYFIVIIIATPCIEDSIRLIDGANCNQGRVEVCDINGEWGTVCDDFWDDLTSIVACNSLGIPGGELG